MKSYRKKSIIQAEPYKKGLEDGFIETCESGVLPYIQTLEGKMLIDKTDYIIIGVKGERYPCKKDIFEETYEEVIV